MTSLRLSPKPIVFSQTTQPKTASSTLNSRLITSVLHQLSSVLPLGCNGGLSSSHLKSITDHLCYQTPIALDTDTSETLFHFISHVKYVCKDTQEPSKKTILKFILNKCEDLSKQSVGVQFEEKINASLLKGISRTVNFIWDQYHHLIQRQHQTEKNISKRSFPLPTVRTVRPHTSPSLTPQSPGSKLQQVRDATSSPVQRDQSTKRNVSSSWMRNVIVSGPVNAKQRIFNSVKTQLLPTKISQSIAPKCDPEKDIKSNFQRYVKTDYTPAELTMIHYQLIATCQLISELKSLHVFKTMCTSQKQLFAHCESNKNIYLLCNEILTQTKASLNKKIPAPIYFESDEIKINRYKDSICKAINHNLSNPHLLRKILFDYKKSDIDYPRPKQIRSKLSPSLTKSPSPTKRLSIHDIRDILNGPISSQIKRLLRPNEWV